jgi:O-antigen ligase
MTASTATLLPEVAVYARELLERVFRTPRSRQAALLVALTFFGLAWGALVAIGGIGAALACVSMVACLCCLLDFRTGVTLLIIVMPISSSVLFPHAMFGMTGMNPLNLLLVMTLGIYLMNSIGTGNMRGFIPRPLWWLYIVPFLAGGIIGMQHVGEIPRSFKSSEMIYFDNTFGYWRDMILKPLGVVVYAMLIGAAVGRSKEPERFVTPMFLSVFVMAALAIGFVIESGAHLSDLAGTYARQFFSALGLHANDLGRLYAVAYALLLFTWDRTHRITLKMLLGVAMGAVTIALLLTFSRGAFLGFVIVNVIYLCSRRTLKTAILAAIALPAAIIFAPGAFWSRLQMGFGQGMDEITAGRLDEIWIPLLPEILKSPPWGNGVGAIMWAKAMKFEEMMFVGHPHNAYFQSYLDLGAIGTACLLGFWLYSWYRFRRLARDDRIAPELQGFFEGGAAGIVSFLIAGIAGSSLMPVPEQSFLWLALGVMWGVQRHLDRGGVGVMAPKAAARVEPAAPPGSWEFGVRRGGA